VPVEEISPRLVVAPHGRQNGRVPQQEVELILARQLAGGLAVPILLIDARGDWLYFNEPAELLLGRRFDEIDALPLEARTAVLSPRDEDGRPMAAEELPGVRALRERRPVHGVLYIHGLDGVVRQIQATALPLESARGHLLGSLVVLWMHDAGEADSGTGEADSGAGDTGSSAARPRP
jgi:PAS domain-containing protein